MINLRRFCYIVSLLLIQGNPLNAQLTHADYLRADSVQMFGDMAYHAFVSPAWIKDTHTFWYEVKTRQGREFFLVDADKKEKIPAFDHKNLAGMLSQEAGKEYDAFSLEIKNILFNKELTEMTFVIDSVRYSLNRQTNELTRIERILPDRREQKHWAGSDDELSEDPAVSPDSVWVAYIRNFNVFIRDRLNGNEHQLSFDGSEGEYYSTHIQWSPDARYLATNKIRPHSKRIVYFVESSPADQLQPKLHSLEYPKPGDAMQIRQPALFLVHEKRQVPVNTQPFLHQYRVTTPQWRDDSRAFTFEFNQRGHQAYQVVEVTAPEGRVNILIDEQSNTFIDYSGKRFRHDADDGREIIWASERDGWNHLYLIDGRTGLMKNQITRGEWVVRGVDHVNDSLRSIIFRGAGLNKGQDPYLVRYYRINFDGTGMQELTPEEANHVATFSDDYQYFVDHYSRIDLPPKTVLRRADNGQVIMTIEEGDITDLTAAGWQTPEVFTAKGRDGRTDIWGNIYRPTNFDPAKSYPVIEAIYAGPHAAHVPKSFRPFFGHFSALAELGFIIVQIDGMGTSHRSKEFHDVCWKNLKDAGFPDRILWIKEAAKKYPYIDISRVGIFGGSAGGQNAMGALLFHPEFYKAAISTVGCHDNRMDKIWWNEQWMGYPIGPHYEENSNVANAHKLQGKLLLTVGEMDNNVDPASTLQVVNALIKAGKEFEFLIYPGQGHGSGGQYGERRKRDFFVKHLLQLDTPDWNMTETK
jgi:hypothetical protein